MRKLGISFIIHVIAWLLLIILFAIFNFDINTTPLWVLIVTFVVGGITWDITREVDKIYED